MSDRRSILVVDDSKLACMMLQKAISSFDPEAMITIAMNGVEAMAFYDKRPATIAIVDYNMPGMSGLELAMQLRRRDATMHIAIISANVQHSLRMEADRIGVAFIPKPITHEPIHAYLQAAYAAPRGPAQ